MQREKATAKTTKYLNKDVKNNSKDRKCDEGNFAVRQTFILSGKDASLQQWFGANDNQKSKIKNDTICNQKF